MEANAPQLSTQVSTQLDRPISLTELAAEIKDLPKGKSPGPNGFTNAYYHAFYPLLATPMCAYFKALAPGTVIPREGLLAHVLDGKDPTTPSSYRPISLLNNDVKILVKILANCPKPIVPTVIHLDQTGFIMGREARDNSNRALQLLHWAQQQTDHPPCLLLSTNAKKAFDRVD